MKITAICAMSSNYVIGNDDKIPFDIPDDRRFFREYCRNKTLVVGYKTFLGLPKLPHVAVFVLTNDHKVDAYNAYISKLAKNHGESPYYQFMTGNMEDLIRQISDSRYLTGGELIIGGGHEIFKTFLPFTDSFILTQFNGQVDGNVKFPVHAMHELPIRLTHKETVFQDPEQGGRANDVWYTRTTTTTGKDGYKRLLASGI